MKQFRQGDVLIEYIESSPLHLSEVPRDKGRIVLAYGEVTGHAHAILDLDAVMFTMPNTTDRFLKIMSSVELRHEEHATITIPLGDYIVRQQREYTPEKIRNVAD